jgi:glycosyltransferase involved in cell wall biosynthesis
LFYITLPDGLNADSVVTVVEHISTEGESETAMLPVVNPLISVVIPAFNEEKNIAELLANTEAALASMGFPFEVIVVDDGSKDKTKHKASNNGAKLISYSVNRGKGYALRKGLANAKGDILVTMDADGSHRPDEISKIVRPLLHGVDVVIGSRFLKNHGGQITSKLNTLGNHAFNILILILTKKKITDSQTGFRAFKRKTLKGIRLFSMGYEIDSELTIKTLRNGFRVHEEPISCDQRRNGMSKLSPLKDGLAILRTILRAGVT